MIDLQEIKARLSEIKSHYEGLEEPTALKERLIRVYAKSTVEKLDKICEEFSSQSSLGEALKAFLKENWALINGTMLSYTALPKLDVHILLGELAEMLSREAGRAEADMLLAGAVKLLMPNVIYEEVAESSQVGLKIAGSDSAVSSGDSDGLIAWRPDSIQELFRTHLQSDTTTSGKQYLIPIWAMGYFNNKDSHKMPRIPNVHFDYERHDEKQAFLTELEIKRLVKHSPLARDLYGSKEQLLLYSNDTSNLLGHLNLLASRLYKNSVYGEGKETVAGDFGEKGIHYFFDYYNQLPEEGKAALPDGLKREIRKLRQCIRQYEAGEEPISHIETCLATRRDLLLEAMQGHEAKLASISLSRDAGGEKIRLVKEELAAQTHTLWEAIKEGSYEGEDDFLLPVRLLTYYGIDFSDIEEEGIALTLMSLNAREINRILSEESISTQVFNKISSVDSLCLLCHHLSPEQLDAFLKKMPESFFVKYIRGEEALGLFLPSFYDTEKFAVICRNIKFFMPCIFDSDEELLKFIGSFAPEQKVIVETQMPSLEIRLIFAIKKCQDERTSSYLAEIESMDEESQAAVLNPMVSRCTEKEKVKLLVLAARYGYVNVVKVLLATGIGVNQARSYDGATPLFVAAYYNHTDVVKLLLAQEDLKVNLARSYSGVTPLYAAAYFGHEGVVESLLTKEGIDVNLAMPDGATPLYIAASNGDTAVVELLLAAGADVNSARSNGFTPLFEAVFNGHESVVELLLSKAKEGIIDVDRATEDGFTPLYAAASKGFIKVVGLLLAAGADVNLAGHKGETPLFAAARNGHTSVVELLLKKGVEASKASADGSIPLHMAIKYGHADVVKLLLAQEDVVKLLLAQKDVIESEALSAERLLEVAKSLERVNVKVVKALENFIEAEEAKQQGSTAQAAEAAGSQVGGGKRPRDEYRALCFFSGSGGSTEKKPRNGASQSPASDQTGGVKRPRKEESGEKPESDAHGRDNKAARG